MISFDMFLTGLFITSILTSLTTEGLKKIFTEIGVTYRSNLLAGIVAVVLSVAACVGHVLGNGLDFTTQTVIYIVLHTFLSWLCAMLGYDKVIQTIKQFKITNKEDVSK